MMTEEQITGELRTLFAARVGATVEFMTAEFGPYRMAPGHIRVGRPRVGFHAQRDGRVVLVESESEADARAPDVVGLAYQRIEGRALDSLAPLLANAGVEEITHAVLRAVFATDEALCVVLDEMHAAGDLP